MSRKVAAGARFIITQLGYDARKFQELIGVQRHMDLDVPTLGSVYVLSPGAAAVMHQGKVPGAVVSDRLLRTVQNEWRDRKNGRRFSIERAARLAAVLRGLGYRGIHIGGIHSDFSTVGLILDRMEQIKDDWREFLADFKHPQAGGFYAFREIPPQPVKTPVFGTKVSRPSIPERLLYTTLRRSHALFFDRRSRLAPLYRAACRAMDGHRAGRLLVHFFEHPLKRMLLGCLQCGDCAIQHVGFLCPESGCPKHTRNGACGGSLQGMCEVHPDRQCIWFRAHNRLAPHKKTEELCTSCVPPRMWELNNTSSWLNFHLDRDHQNNGREIADFCRQTVCRLVPAGKGDS